MALNMKVLPRPTFSPGMSRSDYYLLRSLQHIKRGNLLANIERSFALKPE